MNKTVFIVIDLTPDINFFLPETWPPYKSTPLTVNNSFTLNFSVYTRSYTVAVEVLHCQRLSATSIPMSQLFCCRRCYHADTIFNFMPTPSTITRQLWCLLHSRTIINLSSHKFTYNHPPPSNTAVSLFPWQWQTGWICVWIYISTSS